MQWAKPDDVIDRWIGDEVPATREQLETLILDAQDIITTSIPDIESRIGTSIPEARLARTIVKMIHRLLQNPDGVRQRMQVAGSFTEQVMYSGNEPGGLELTERDRRELIGRRTRRAFTVYPPGV